MSHDIHPTAVVHDRAELGDGVKIGPYTVIGPDVTIGDRTEIGPTPLGALIVAIQEFLTEKEPEAVMANLRDAVVDYLHLRPVLIDMTDFIAAKARAAEVRRAAEAIASRMQHQRLQ